MSNEAYLIATDSPGPAGVNFDSEVGYDPEEIVANAPYALPVFWLSLFDTADLMFLDVTGDDDEVTVPSLVAERIEAKRRLDERREVLAQTFPEFRPTWERFAGFVDRMTPRFVKVQMQELWDMEPDEFPTRLEAALRWFNSRSEGDFAVLLEMASISGYDEVQRTYPGEGEDVPRAFHMRGYASEDSDWDDKSDI